MVHFWGISSILAVVRMVVGRYLLGELAEPLRRALRLGLYSRRVRKDVQAILVRLPAPPQSTGLQVPKARMLKM